MKTLTSLSPEIIEGARGPCRAHSGLAVALQYGGHDVIVMGGSRAALAEIVHQLNPNLSINPAGVYPVTLIHDHYVIRKDGDL
jgi:hypothetical protein